MAVSGEYVYLNGSIKHKSEAAISLFDVGLLRGYAVFDLLQTIGGEPFMLVPHLQRFRDSARTLGLSVPATDDEIAEIVTDLLARNGHTEATVRMVLTGGDSPDGMHYDSASPTFFIITHEMFDVPQTAYENGVKLLAVEHRRELPSAKTTNYLTWLKNHPLIEEQGAMDLLYHDGGIISEAATASFYVVSGGRILAPNKGVLWGTVGSYVLQLAEEHYEVAYGDIALETALAADECFLTSSVRGVVPVCAIDEHQIADGRVGPVTRHLIELFREAAYKR